MAIMTINLVLTGGRAGRTCVCGRYQFVNGKCPVSGESTRLGGAITYLGRVFAAFPEGSTELAAHQKRDAHGDAEAAPDVGSGDATPILGDVPNDGSVGAEAATTGEPAAAGGDAPAEHGAAGYRHPDSRLREAVMGLDKNDPEHWTEAGKPRLDAVVRAYGSANVTRRDVDRVAPDFVRTGG